MSLSRFKSIRNWKKSKISENLEERNFYSYCPYCGGKIYSISDIDFKGACEDCGYWDKPVETDDCKLGW